MRRGFILHLVVNDDGNASVCISLLCSFFRDGVSIDGDEGNAFVVWRLASCGFWACRGFG